MNCLRTSRKRTAGFTLVELLVVIGIIAVLISIILPALTQAKRAAAAAKCAAALREIGNAFQMYAIDSKGWYPPAQLQPDSGVVYNIDGIDYPSKTATSAAAGYNAMWFNFISKYLTKYNTGGAISTDKEAQLQRNTVIWGCPAWEGYFLTSNVGNISSVQTGYGMNGWPTMTSQYPKLPATLPPGKEGVFIQKWGTANQTGNFQKQKVWARQGSERCLIADCVYWLVESEYCASAATMAGQGDLTNGSAVFFVTGSTTIDAYRHGKYPAHIAPGQFSAYGGKVLYNVLFVDGHVAGSPDRTQAFKVTRMKFPG